jgi:hypothetical protein
MALARGEIPPHVSMYVLGRLPRVEREARVRLGACMCACVSKRMRWVWTSIVLLSEGECPCCCIPTQGLRPEEGIREGTKTCDMGGEAG